LLVTLASEFEPWRRRHARLSREMRDWPYLLSRESGRNCARPPMQRWRMRRTFFIAIIALLVASAPSRGQAPTYAPTYAFDVFGAYVESLRAQAGIPGLAAAVVGEDGILWEHAYGRQDLTRNI